MSKNVFKEIIIAMLLCLVIILVLGVVLYSYVPANKTLPPKIAYTTPEEVAEELKTSSEADTDEIVLTYEIDNNDMNNYENINSYNPGKSNPFTRFVETQDGTIVTNPKNSANEAEGGSNSSAGSNNQGSSLSGTATSTGTTGATSGNSGSSSNNGGSTGGQPGYYNYKNGK